MKSVKEFVPHRLLRNRHLMTMAASAFAEALSAAAASSAKAIRRGAGNTIARSVSLACATAQTSHSAASARPGRVKRLGLYPRLRGEGLDGGLQRCTTQSEELRRHGAAYFHALSFRA